jgi:hypothetical protein
MDGMRRLLPSLLTFGLLAAACGSDGGGGSTGSTAPTGPTDATGSTAGMVAVAASVDLYVGDPNEWRSVS